jgi:hypothetical protein
LVTKYLKDKTDQLWSRCSNVSFEEKSIDAVFYNKFTQSLGKKNKWSTSNLWQRIMSNILYQEATWAAAEVRKPDSGFRRCHQPAVAYGVTKAIY